MMLDHSPSHSLTLTVYSFILNWTPTSGYHAHFCQDSNHSFLKLQRSDHTVFKDATSKSNYIRDFADHRQAILNDECYSYNTVMLLYINANLKLELLVAPIGHLPQLVEPLSALLDICPLPFNL